jgi:hypothetical protein
MENIWSITFSPGPVPRNRALCRHAMSGGGTRAHLEEPAVSRAEGPLAAAGGGLSGLRS